MMSSDASLYSRIGGEGALRKFVDDLYDFMENTPDVAHVRAMHKSGLAHASNRLFMFLSGMFGGPPLYMEAFGHPRLRQKHLHIKIGNDERDQWMKCAQHAAEQLDIASPVRGELIATLAGMADHLRNDDSLTDCRPAVGQY